MYLFSGFLHFSQTRVYFLQHPHVPPTFPSLRGLERVLYTLCLFVLYKRSYQPAHTARPPTPPPTRPHQASSPTPPFPIQPDNPEQQ